MTLISCPECKNEISSEANSCPSCGYSLAKGKDKKSSSGCLTGCLGILLILFILGILCDFGADSPRSSYSSSRRSGTSSKSSVSTGQGKRISGNSWVGCTDRKYQEKLSQYVLHEDRQAFHQALVAGQLAGICTMFKDGEVVYIVDSTVFSGLVKVRRKGETQEYWTYTEAVE